MSNLDLRRITIPAFTRVTTDPHTRVVTTTDHPARHHPMCQECQHAIERFRATSSVNAHKFCRHECHSIDIPSQEIIATWPEYDRESVLAPEDPYFPGKQIEKKHYDTVGNSVSAGKYK
jgi:hypothetical protein